MNVLPPQSWLETFVEDRELSHPVLTDFHFYTSTFQVLTPKIKLESSLTHATSSNKIITITSAKLNIWACLELHI